MFTGPANQHPPKKKKPYTFAHLTNVSAMFDSHTILFVWRDRPGETSL